MHKALTKQQQKVLVYIAKSIDKKGVQPSYREIMKHFGFRSPNAVLGHLKACEKKGACKRSGCRAVQFNWRGYL